MSLILIAGAAFLVAGVIKGVAGIGLPTASIALMTLVLDPRTAIALVMFPMVGSNLWQLLRSGQIVRTAKRYWLFALILFAGVVAFQGKSTPKHTISGVSFPPKGNSNNIDVG